MNDQDATVNGDAADDLRSFLIMLRWSLLNIVSWIDKRYNLPPPGRYRRDPQGPR